MSEEDHQIFDLFKDEIVSFFKYLVMTSLSSDDEIKNLDESKVFFEKKIHNLLLMVNLYNNWSYYESFEKNTKNLVFTPKEKELVQSGMCIMFPKDFDKISEIERSSYFKDPKDFDCLNSDLLLLVIQYCRDEDPQSYGFSGNLIFSKTIEALCTFFQREYKNKLNN